MTTDLPDPLIELVGVRAGYGRIEVLHGVDLAVSPGRFSCLLGPNGAGKSTTLGVLAGLVPATAGHVHIADWHVNGADPDALARIGVCLIPEGRGIFPNLSVADNRRGFSTTGSSADDVQDGAYARFPVLGQRRSQLAGTLSGGEQQMLALARGLATDPAVLLLDELSMGLAPIIVGDLYESVAGIVADGVTVVAVEQFARLVLGVADDAAVMSQGRITFRGTPAEASTMLEGAYLGAR